MTDTPLHWLAEADDVAIRADLERAIALVKASLQPNAEDDPDITERALRRCLRVLSDTGPRAVPPANFLPFAFPVLRKVELAGRPERFQTELGLLSSHDGIHRSPDIATRLAKLRGPLPADVPKPDPEPTTVPAPPAGPELATPQPPEEEHPAWFTSGDPPPIGDALGGGRAGRLIRLWAQARQSRASDGRPLIDMWMLRLAVMSRTPVPPDLADALYEDEALWASPDAARFASDTAEPFRAEIVGRAPAGLLNARLRRLNPRMFLRSPWALVIEPIGERIDVDALEEGLIDQVGAPLRRLVTRLAEEDTRPTRALLRDLAKYGKQVLESFGCELKGTVNFPTRFDPEAHVATRPLERGTPVKIVEPALVDATSGVLRLKALVEVDDGTGTDPDETNGQDEPTAPVVPDEVTEEQDK